MPHADFSDARAKLTRANEHIADVQTRIDQFLTTDFYRLRFEPEQGTRGVKLFFDSLHQPDKRINAVIGDAISNMRSSLDYIATALTKPMRSQGGRIYFPIASDISNFKTSVKNALAACPRIIHDYFIDEVQAYKGGKGNAFWILHNLRNIDQHRVLITTTELAGVKFSGKTGGVFISDLEVVIKAGQSGALITTPYPLEITNQPKPTFRIHFREPPHVPDSPVIALLHEIASDTEGLLNALEVIL